MASGLLPRLDQSGAPGPTPAQLRRSMAEFATGVTVVTGMDGDVPVGFACQAFASVSLDPPLVLFCADHAGRAWPRMRASGRFCVNVLAEDQAELCARFGARDGQKFRGLAWDVSRWATPALPDVLCRVHAEVVTVHPEGDHDVVVGRVLELDTVRGRRPMIFFRGHFGLDRDEAALAESTWGWGDRWG